MRTALTGRTHGCSDHCCMREENPCQPGAVHTWPITPNCCNATFVSRQGSSRRRARRSPLHTDNDANHALNFLKPLRSEREAYFDPAICRSVDVEDEPRAGELDQAKPEEPSIPVGLVLSYSKRRHRHSSTVPPPSRRGMDRSLRAQASHLGLQWNMSII